jgi:NADH:ubiquinone oxidoreductase subunit 6 (subunit J)
MIKLSAQMSFWGALVLFLACGAVGVHGLWSVRGIADEATRADAQGFAWFWLFLAAVALLICILSALMAKGKLGGADQ